MARRGQRQSGNTRTAPRNTSARNGAQKGGAQKGAQKGKRALDNEGLIPVLARAVREVENGVQRGAVAPSVRTKFQVIGLLVREERARVKTDTERTEAFRAEQLKRLDGIATILAKTAARDPSLLMLLSEDADISDSAVELKRRMLTAAGLEVPEEKRAPEPDGDAPSTPRRVVPRSVIARQLANPFLTPDFEAAAAKAKGTPRRLAGWELLEPLFRSFEYVGKGTSSCMPLPEPESLDAPDDLTLMRHQGQVVAAAAAGHRTFLLADEPGLGKTAQALLAAEAADAYPLLVVVPNVVKTNWAREVGLWTPRRTATVIHGDGHELDGFADIMIVNYEILDRHVGWLADHGFRGMVVDEAHFIKNKTSQRSQHVLQLSERIRDRAINPLLMALTGTPLINDIEDFRAIWQFLGWIDDKRPLGELMEALEETGLTPADLGFYAAARNRVVDMGIVRRRKVDVADDIPARRVADLPVELDEAVGRSIRDAERELARRLVERYKIALETRRSDRRSRASTTSWSAASPAGSSTTPTARPLARTSSRWSAGSARPRPSWQPTTPHSWRATSARSCSSPSTSTSWTWPRRPSTAARIGFASIRGDQTPKAREKAIDDFQNDPDCQVIVCSLMAAGVGMNLQVASNLVLAELSWTAAEQTQAIDRIHRIGQVEPVTAWRVIAAQTIDTKIAELIDAKAGLAARALDASDEEVASSADVQLEALVALLTEALENDPEIVPRHIG